MDKLKICLKTHYLVYNLNENKSLCIYYSNTYVLHATDKCKSSLQKGLKHKLINLVFIHAEACVCHPEF